MMFFIVSFTLSCNVTMDDGTRGERENKDCGGEASCRKRRRLAYFRSRQLCACKRENTFING